MKRFALFHWRGDPNAHMHTPFSLFLTHTQTHTHNLSSMEHFPLVLGTGSYQSKIQREMEETVKSREREREKKVAQRHPQGIRKETETN